MFSLLPLTSLAPAGSLSLEPAQPGLLGGTVGAAALTASDRSRHEKAPVAAGESQPDAGALHAQKTPERPKV